MANDGVDTRTIQAYLGHKDIRHTVRYTELSPMQARSAAGRVAPNTPPAPCGFPATC
jgi:site-specific recombinase XerD